MRALTLHVLGPVTHFPFEEWWTEEAHYKTVVATRDPEFPAVFREMYSRMLSAIEAEKERRRARGDPASVERFEREWAWIIDAEEHDPAFREQFEAERRIVRNATGNWGLAGWWAWIAPPEARCIQAFLRGDDVDIARRATPPRTKDEETGRAVPAWTASGSNRGPGSAISVLGPITHYTFEEAWTREAHLAYAQSDDLGKTHPPEPAWTLARGGIERGLEAEKDRRHACGDHGSVERFERRRKEIFEGSKGSITAFRDRIAPDLDMEEWRIVKSAPDTWPDVRIWTWISPPQVRLWQAFLRGDPIEGEPVLADFPITHFRFEEPWTDDDRQVMDAWKDGDPLPAACQRMEHAIEGAIFTEKMRRRAIGDEASIADFDRQLAGIYEGRNDPAFMERVNAQRAEVLHSCPHWGWWMWMNVPTVLLVQRFLRGEPMGDAGTPAPGAGAPPDVPGDAGPRAASPTRTQDTPAPAAAPPAGATSEDATGPEFITHFPFEETWTDDDHTAMSECDPESIPFAYRRVFAGMELAILTEKRRRRAVDDTASIAAFERERASIGTRYAEDPAFQEECTAQRLTVLETTGRQWGWWIWLPVPEVRLIQMFLCGEPIGDTDAPTADSGARGDPALALHEQVSAAAAAELGLDSLSITHFPFEASWTSAADSVMQAAGNTGAAPPAWPATLQGLAQATDTEKERRRSVGDSASVERFEVGYTRWVLESKRNSRFRNAWWRESSFAAVYSGEDWGFWKYWPLVQVQGIQTFLRGEPISDAYVAGPASPTPPVHLFPFEEPWSVDDDVYMTVRTNDSHPRAWDTVMTGFDAAIRAEKARRQAARDKYSLHRFETLTARIGEEMADPQAQARGAEELKAAAARGEDWTQSFWQWHYPPLARLAIAFLRGERLQPPDAQGPTPSAAGGAQQTAASPETTTAPTTTASPQPAPRTWAAADAAVPSAECWEPQWGAAQIAAVWSWTRDGAPPEAFVRTLTGMNTAVAREKDRRRGLGDGASVERFEREMQIADERTHADEQAWRSELFAALSRRDDVGFWDCMPPRMAVLTRRFLRGEDAG